MPLPDASIVKQIFRAGQIPGKIGKYLLFSSELKQKGKGGLRTTVPSNAKLPKLDTSSGISSVEAPPSFIKVRFMTDNPDTRAISLVHVTNLSISLAVPGKSEHKLNRESESTIKALAKLPISSHTIGNNSKPLYNTKQSRFKSLILAVKSTKPSFNFNALSSEDTALLIEKSAPVSLILRLIAPRLSLLFFSIKRISGIITVNINISAEQALSIVSRKCSGDSSLGFVPFGLKGTSQTPIHGPSSRLSLMGPLSLSRQLNWLTYSAHILSPPRPFEVHL